MKRFALLAACVAVLGASTGCCCLTPWCGGGYGGGYGACQPAPACSPCSPYGAGYAPTSAYYPGASVSAGLAIGPSYAATPYPVMATAPLDILPTY
jgi:hypothetical protein